MFVLESYPVAVLFCIVTMICWGSWANTQKAVGARWRFELFYWDYVFGVLLASLVFAFTLGSMGHSGRGFLADLRQADMANIGSALLGGVIFNAANILLVAAIAIAGMAVAFPVGIGLALVLGVIVNYIGGEQSGSAVLLFLGVALVMAAIILDALAYRKLPGHASGGGAKGLVLSVLCGILMSLFYFSVARSIGTAEGKLSAYSANVIFAVGIILSNLVFNTAIMAKPFVGAPVPLSDYFKGQVGDHLWGIVGGCIWGVGMGLNIVAANVASPAISYGLGQGATLVAALWGVFVWREFRNAPRGTSNLLGLMFAAYVFGLALVIAARLV